MNYYSFFLYVITVILSLSVHEFAHGYAAWYKGDSTAKSDGRLSLNPFAHLDPLGTIVFIITAISFRVPVGWAKPVPVNPMNLDNPKRDMIFVAMAGPLSNICLALVFGYSYIILRDFNLPISVNGFLYLMVRVNLGLAIFNLLPIPPLDGSNIIRGFLPADKLITYIKYSSLAPRVLVALYFIGVLTRIPLLSYVLMPIFSPWFYFWKTIVFSGRIPL